MKLSFTQSQELAIHKGQQKRKRLKRTTRKAAESSMGSKKKHYYIYGPSGIGKTYNMEKELEASGVTNYTISGNISMWAFAVQLACIKVNHPDEKVVILVDDCDELLKDGKSANQLKELLAEGSFSYNKKPQMHMLTSEFQIACVEQFLSDDSLGFSVPCENFTFVITSNFQLPYDDTPEKMLEKNEGAMTARIQYLKHLTAIRGRMEVKDISLDWEEKWGNITDVVMNDNGCPDLNEQQKIFLLQWMWTNWNNMTETSIRTAEKMADILIDEGEEGIQDAWEIDFLK
jgi:hypothetical protein